MQLTVTAQGTVAFRPDKFDLVSSEKLPKGPFLETARLAAFLAAKRDSFFGSRVFITHMEIKHHWGPSELSFTVRLVADGDDEKEIMRRAWFSAFVCCLTTYDMVKAVDPDAVIEDVGVVSINDEDLPEVDLSHADLSDFQDGYYCGFSPTLIVERGQIRSAFNAPWSNSNVRLRWLTAGKKFEGGFSGE